MELSSAYPLRNPNPTPVVVNRSPSPVPARTAANTRLPVARISNFPMSRNGAPGAGKPVVGVPAGSGGRSIASVFTFSNQTNAGSSNVSASEKQSNLDAAAARKNGVLGCVTKGTKQTANPGCATPCDTVNCLEKMLLGNLLDLDAKKLMCGVVSSVERGLKHNIDATGDNLLDAAKSLTDLGFITDPLSKINSFVNGIDPGQVANCFGAQAVKDKITGQVNKAKNTIKKFQNGYQDKLAKGFNKASEALQQFSITPNLCAQAGSPASLRAGLAKLS